MFSLNKKYLKLLVIVSMLLIFSGCNRSNKEEMEIPVTEVQAEENTTADNQFEIENIKEEEETVEADTKEVKNEVEASNIEKSSLLSELDAKKAAYKDANIKEDNVTFSSISLEINDNRLIYSVDFIVDSKIYNYQVNSRDGRIVKRESRVFGIPKEIQILSEEEAKQIITDKLGDMKDNPIQIDLKEKNEISIYQGNFEYSSKKYEFEINAETGVIIKWDVK